MQWRWSSSTLPPPQTNSAQEKLHKGEDGRSSDDGGDHRVLLGCSLFLGGLIFCLLTLRLLFKHVTDPGWVEVAPPRFRGGRGCRPVPVRACLRRVDA